VKNHFNSARLELALGLLLATAVPGKCFYNPNTGKWLSRDPTWEHGGSSLYLFAGNRPTTSVDYLGLLEVKHIGPGFAYVKGPPEIFWLGLQARLTPDEAANEGARGILLTKVDIEVSVSDCCGQCQRTRAGTRFYLDRFRLNGAALAPLSGDSVEEMTDGSASVTFQPVNFPALLILKPCESTSLQTKGEITLNWKFKLQPFSEPLWHADGFNPPTDRGYDFIFWPESVHKFFSDSEPWAWSYFAFAEGSYKMSFSWDNCFSYLPAFSATPRLPEGPQRQGRSSFPDAEWYR
jgi:RHS repeat-associated protein